MTKNTAYKWQDRARKLIKEEFGGEPAFCELIGKSQSWLNGKLHNRRKCSYEDLMIIAEGFSISPGELITHPDEYMIIKKYPEKAKTSLIHQVQEIAAEYVAKGKEDELQEISDLMNGRLTRLDK